MGGFFLGRAGVCAFFLHLGEGSFEQADWSQMWESRDFKKNLHRRQEFIETAFW